MCNWVQKTFKWDLIKSWKCNYIVIKKFFLTITNTWLACDWFKRFLKNGAECLLGHVLEWRDWEEKLLGKRREGYRDWRGCVLCWFPSKNSFPAERSVGWVKKAQGALATPHCPETAGTTTSVLHPYTLNSPLRPWTHAHTHRPPDRTQYEANKNSSSRIQGLLRWRDCRWTGKESINIFCSPEQRTAEGEFVLTYASDHTCSGGTGRLLSGNVYITGLRKEPWQLLQYSERF